MYASSVNSNVKWCEKASGPSSAFRRRPCHCHLQDTRFQRRGCGSCCDDLDLTWLSARVLQGTARHQHYVDWRPDLTLHRTRSSSALQKPRCTTFSRWCDDENRTSSRSITSGRWQGRRITSRRSCSYGPSLSRAVGCLGRRRKSTRSLLRGRKGSLRSTYLVSSCNNTGRTVKSVGDASIHGIGAYLMVDRKVMSSFASPITKLERTILGDMCW